MFFYCCWTWRVAVKASRLFARWKRWFSSGRWWMWWVRSASPFWQSPCLIVFPAPFIIFTHVLLLFISSHSHIPPLSLFFPFYHLLSPAGCFINDCLTSFLPPPLSPPFFPQCLPLHSGSAAVILSRGWPLGWSRGCNTGHGSFLSPLLVSCVAASGAACLHLRWFVCPPAAAAG